MSSLHTTEKCMPCARAASPRGRASALARPSNGVKRPCAAASSAAGRRFAVFGALTTTALAASSLLLVRSWLAALAAAAGWYGFTSLPEPWPAIALSVGAAFALCLIVLPGSPSVWRSPVVAKINGMNYTRSVIKVAKVTLDGATCVVPIGDLYDLLEGGQEYTVRVETMPVRDFERLAEFTGW